MKTSLKIRVLAFAASFLVTATLVHLITDRAPAELPATVAAQAVPHC